MNKRPDYSKLLFLLPLYNAKLASHRTMVSKDDIYTESVSTSLPEPLVAHSSYVSPVQQDLNRIDVPKHHSKFLFLQGIHFHR